MSEFVLKDASLVVGGVDLSDHVRQITIGVSADVPQNTAMGSDWHTRLPGGIKDWSLSVEFNQDFAAGSVDATLFANVGSVVAIAGKPTSAAASATNPIYSGNAILQSYSPIDGTVGEDARTPAEFVATGVLTRGVA